MRIAGTLLLATFLGGCENRAVDADAAAAASVPQAGAEAMPQQFGIGRIATPEEVARIDIDIMPDGRGLPPGSGTATQGAAIYAARCANCHGADGEGTPVGSALVGRKEGDAFDFANSIETERGKTIGNYWPYATTLFDYIRRSMPFDQPGSLSNDEVYALSAYLLNRNDIIGGEAVMNATTLPEVRMPARDRFRQDDRLTSTRVR